MTNLFNNSEGIVIYDELIGQGMVIVNVKYNKFDNNKNNDELFDNFNLTKIGYNKDYCEIHGNTYFKNNVFELKSYSQEKYDDIGDGWKVKYFKDNMYDQFGNNLNKLGIKFQCIEPKNKRQENNTIININNYSKL